LDFDGFNVSTSPVTATVSSGRSGAGHFVSIWLPPRLTVRKSPLPMISPKQQPMVCSPLATSPPKSGATLAASGSRWKGCGSYFDA
jgi:hypothetical protein